jgi:hypothetical protein
VQSGSSAGPKGPSGRACSSATDSRSAAGMGPASQSKKGADTHCGETVSKGRRVTSRVVSFVIAGLMYCTNDQVVADCMQSLVCRRLIKDTMRVSRLTRSFICSKATKIWYIVGSFEAFPTISTWRKGMDAHIHTLHVPSSRTHGASWREERRLLAQLEHAVSDFCNGRNGQPVRASTDLVCKSTQLPSAICY